MTSTAEQAAGLAFHFRHLDVMERITQISLSAEKFEDALSQMLDVVLDTFDAHRASLLHPCDPDLPVWCVPMERTRPEWPGLFALGKEMPQTPEISAVHRELMGTKGPLLYGPFAPRPVPPSVAQQFSVQSQIVMVLRPQVGTPWLLVMHHCVEAQDYSADTAQLFSAVAKHISDTLSGLISINRLRESEERLRLVLAGANDGWWDWDLVTDQIRYSPRWWSMLGYVPDELPADSALWRRLMHPDDLNRVQPFLADALQGGLTDFEIECGLLHKQGHYVPILGRGLILRNENGKAVRMSGTNTDLTGRKQAEEALRLAAMVYQHSSEAMMVSDAANNIIAINPAFTKMTGYTADEVLGKNPRILGSGRHDAAFHQAVWEALNTAGSWQGEIWNRRKDGDFFAELLTINTIRHENGAVYRYVALFSDITQKKASEQIIWRQANYDLLTQLPNRRMFHDMLEQEIKLHDRSGAQLALLFIDLDRFKEVNDTLGHHVGDLLLVEAARRISEVVRDTDRVARLGGDEFTIILSQVDSTAGGIERVAQNILKQLAAPFQLGEERAFVSASIGITLYPHDTAEIADLLKYADQAMYAAKSAGRNRYSYFTCALQQASETRMRLVNDMHTALAADQFQLHYQPIVELSTGRIQKAEALIRWQHPVHGLISPAEFIPIAEQTGMILEIGDWVFKEAARQARQWRTQHDPQFQISVNVSPVQFLHEVSRGVKTWIAYLRRLNLPGASISVEITEGLLLDSAPIVTTKLLEFRDAGVQVSLDDFGTGYSSLSYLKKFDIDYIKIDQSFVRNLERDSNDKALCEAIIVMAHKLGLKVVAEGVETEGQHKLLLDAGCDYAQGYLFSRPVAAADFIRLLGKAAESGGR